MDKRLLQTYSTWAKENLEMQIEVSLKAFGINDDTDIKKAKRVGDFTVIEGDDTTYPADMLGKRNYIVSLVDRMGYRNVIEEFAYTWFNRFVALRFMEVHGFLSHGFRVLSNPGGGIEPEIMKNLNLVANELSLDMKLCVEYKQQGKIEELYRYVLLHQCNALAGILPMLFSSDFVYLDLLLPKTLLKGETVITRLVDIPEEYFLEDVEIIGWMYQFYISSKKDAVYASKKTITKYTLPAVTQLFTPDWIVRYMAENSVGRLWLESYPNSSLRSEMKYYVEDAEQTAEVQKKIDEINYKNVNPEEIRIIEPCCGSGHILVYVFDLLYKMYEEQGYQKRDIPTLILKNNLTGLDVDKRAVQLASFSLVMKARSVNNRFFNDKYYEAPHVYELQDSKLLKELRYRKQLQDLKIFSDEEINLIAYLVDTFENGKTIGSLLRVKPIDFARLDGALNKLSENTITNLFNIDFMNMGMKRLRELSDLTKVLSAKYDVMITNPPYRPISSMEAKVSDYASKFYPDSKADMYSMFMETDFVRTNGFLSMINMHSWMSLSTFKSLREKMLREKSLVVMAHLGPRAFDSIGGEVVQTTAFVLRNAGLKNYSGVYFDLVDGKSENEKMAMFLDPKNKYIANQANFKKIEGTPYTAYWVSNRFLRVFDNQLLSNVAKPRQGLATGGNDRFLRFWHEVNFYKIGFGCASREVAQKSKKKWFPCNKGGSFRKWYGNQEYVVNWENDGLEIRNNRDDKGKQLSRPQNIDFYFRKGMTWSTIANRLSMRLSPLGSMFETKGSVCFPNKESDLNYLLGLMNTPIVDTVLSVISPTLDYHEGPLGRVPVIIDAQNKTAVEETVEDCIQISREDWNAFETSWDFEYHPLILTPMDRADAESTQFANSRMEKIGSLAWHYERWENECQSRFDTLKVNEEKINHKFISIYGLQEELSSEIKDADVTVRLADKERDIRSLISYLVGVAMGRYSLDVPGLAYAGGEWDASKYVTYQPDDDGIIPIYNGIGMEDGLTTVIICLIKLIYGEDTYRQNIDFIAEALGKKNNESSEETLNRYLNDGFYTDHLKIYQKRPIYWMFSSGKKAGFKCLIYMHRYNEDTLARINAKYYLPESTRKKNELDELNGRITKVEGRDKLRLEKERQNLAAAYNEALEYGQVLDHMANQYIAIDLDDGVKVNYAKFQGVQLVTDSGTKVKKDLLVPLK